MRKKELETLRQKKFANRKCTYLTLEHLHFSIAFHQHFILAIQTTEVEKEAPKEEESPLAKNITASLAKQSQFAKRKCTYLTLEHLHVSIASHQHFILAIQTTEVEKEAPEEEENPRAKNITAFLANQTQSILEERRQQRRPLDRLQANYPFTWVQKQMNTIEMAENDHALTWKQVVEKSLEEMNNEIWQYEKRTIITDAQSIALLVITALFLLRTFVSLQIIIIVDVLVFNLTQLFCDLFRFRATYVSHCYIRFSSIVFPGGLW
jgi:hypothetical protein